MLLEVIRGGWTTHLNYLFQNVDSCKKSKARENQANLLGTS